jgi:hypothetical protein
MSTVQLAEVPSQRKKVEKIADRRFVQNLDAGRPPVWTGTYPYDGTDCTAEPMLGGALTGFRNGLKDNAPIAFA